MSSPRESEECSVDEEAIISQAKAILQERVRRGMRVKSTSDAVDLIQLHLSSSDRELFGCVFLDTRHQVIEFEILFQGTINRSHVHPRIVVKQALDLNAVAVILCHNHPSGDPNPSHADISLTKQLKETLQLFDITVLDHVVVGGGTAYCFASHGLL